MEGREVIPRRCLFLNFIPVTPQRKPLVRPLPIRIHVFKVLKGTGRDSTKQCKASSSEKRDGKHLQGTVGSFLLLNLCIDRYLSVPTATLLVAQRDSLQMIGTLVNPLF
jgi:hypothetical protein